MCDQRADERGYSPNFWEAWEACGALEHSVRDAAREHLADIYRRRPPADADRCAKALIDEIRSGDFDPEHLVRAAREDNLEYVRSGGPRPDHKR